MEESDYESFLVDDKIQGSKYLPLKLFPPDQEITCEYLRDIPPPQYFRRGKAPLKDADIFTNRIVVYILELPYIIPLIFPRPAGPSYTMNAFTDDLQKHCKGLSLVSQSFSNTTPTPGTFERYFFFSDPHENSYDGAVIEYEPEFDRLLRTCGPNVFRKGTSSETEAELNLLASNPAPQRFYAVANFLKPKPDLDLPASVSLPKRLSFAAQDFLDSEEPDLP
ncbi:uncharacterized protein EAF02_001080 [Botrytis sinoallii]|uniref:uncharacterized protein n=1 Tax=Botrytis sinoallii TaxID=1463999 RepID=UPI001901FDF2|nr:uncharacterized protein EAF02_001080 [Botrytis sinoallii]KAF7893542.1 hypothetical protein EAF02_001080 [Botrytis sinoallii]